jgi:hypothetical protein
MKFRIISLSILLLAFASCRKELLSPVPRASISDQVAFATPERTLAAVNGMYASIKTTGQPLTNSIGRYFVWQDVRGEEFINETTNGVTGLQTYNFTVDPAVNEVQNLWGAFYQAVNSINVVLAGIDRSPVSDAQKNQYRGEGRFLRALVFHYLVTLYARPYWDNNGNTPGIVLYTEPQLTSGNNDKARATVAQVYTQILEDLNFAEANLPTNYATTTLNVTRAHKNAAIALKTRVYLHMGRYADVITEANKIVSAAAPFTATTGVAHSLESNIANVFKSGGQTPENIFSFPHSTQDVPGTQNSLHQYYSPGSVGGNGDYSLNAVNGIYAEPSWTATDARRVNFVEMISAKPRLRKWTANTDFVPVIRYAEVLLNLAEALARTNGVDARAIALLNAVRKRSDPATTLAPASQQALIDAILLERRIELLGEGFRSPDLLRLGMALPGKAAIAAVPTTHTQYIWPIPLSELLVNKAIVQNQGY